MNTKNVLIALSAAFVGCFPTAVTARVVHLPFFDHVYYSDAIVVADIVSIDATHDVLINKAKHIHGTADLTVRVVESLKGDLSDKVKLYDLDLGPDGGNPYGNLRDLIGKVRPDLGISSPDELVGRKLLLFILGRRSTDEHGVAGRYVIRLLIENGQVRDPLFLDMKGKDVSLSDVRGMIVQFHLIEPLCPFKIDRRPDFAPDPAAALAACRVALHSEYPQVVRYGAAGLWRNTQGKIPNDFLPDLLAALKRPENIGVANLLYAIERIGDPHAVPGLIDLLRRQNKKEPKYTPKRTIELLEKLTNENFGRDAEKWRRWWLLVGQKQADHKKNKPDHKQPM